MQYCSLQHQTLLSPPYISTTERHFCFGPAASFFLELLVIAFWSSSIAFGLIFFLPFHTVHGVLMARILEWGAISSSSGPWFVRTLHYDLSVLGGPAWHVSWIHWVIQTPLPWQGYDPWRGHEGMKDAQVQSLALVLSDYVVCVRLLISLGFSFLSGNNNSIFKTSMHIFSFNFSQPCDLRSKWCPLHE